MMYTYALFDNDWFNLLLLQRQWYVNVVDFTHRLVEGPRTKSGTRSEILRNDHFISLPSIIYQSIRPINEADESNGIERPIRKIWGTSKNKPGQTAAQFSYHGYFEWRLNEHDSTSETDIFVNEESSNFDNLDPVEFISILRKGRSTDDLRVSADHPRIRQVFIRH